MTLNRTKSSIQRGLLSLAIWTIGLVLTPIRWIDARLVDAQARLQQAKKKP